MVVMKETLLGTVVDMETNIAYYLNGIVFTYFMYFKEYFGHISIAFKLSPTIMQLLKSMTLIYL